MSTFHELEYGDLQSQLGHDFSLLESTTKLTCRGGWWDVELQKAVMPPRSGAAFGSAATPKAATALGRSAPQPANSTAAALGLPEPHAFSAAEQAPARSPGQPTLRARPRAGG